MPKGLQGHVQRSHVDGRTVWAKRGRQTRRSERYMVGTEEVRDDVSR
jgi:hypothetical protein